jgi:Family of unknown function (DUF6979)
MGQYGTAACMAAEFVESGEIFDPRAAWSEAMKRVTESSYSRNKGCPKSTFLGLCESGAVKGVPAGDYTTSPDNKVYAQRALEALRSTQSLSENQAALWNLATEGSGKAPNGQMDVLLALWRAGRLPLQHWPPG